MALDIKDKTGWVDLGNSSIFVQDSRIAVVDPSHQNAIDEIYAAYGHQVTIKGKAKSLLKFGRSEQVQTATYTTLMTLPTGVYNETYPAANTNSIDYVVSSSTSDTMQVTIEGHTESGGNKTFVTQTATLTGQTPVPLSTPLNRATRCYVSSGTADNLGVITVMRGNAVTGGAPTAGADANLQVRVGRNQSEKASTSLSSTDYWIIHGVYASMLSKNDWNAEVTFEVRPSGGVFRPYFDMSCSKHSEAFRTGDPHIIIPPNSDVRLRALSSNAGAIVAGGVFGVLATTNV